MYPEDEDMPEKPKGVDFGIFVKQIVAARRIQNTWIIYQAIKREQQEEQMANSYNQRFVYFFKIIIRIEKKSMCKSAIL